MKFLLEYVKFKPETTVKPVLVYHGHNNPKHKEMWFGYFPYFYMTPVKKYAKNFGTKLQQYEIDDSKFLDLTSLEIKEFPIPTLMKKLIKFGINLSKEDIEKMVNQWDERFWGFSEGCLWQVIRNDYEGIIKKVMLKHKIHGFKMMENKEENEPPTLSYVLLDDTLILKKIKL